MAWSEKRQVGFAGRTHLPCGYKCEWLVNAITLDNCRVAPARIALSVSERRLSESGPFWASKRTTQTDHANYDWAAAPELVSDAGPSSCMAAFRLIAS